MHVVVSVILLVLAISLAALAFLTSLFRNSYMFGDGELHQWTVQVVSRHKWLTKDSDDWLVCMPILFGICSLICWLLWAGVSTPATT